MENKKGENAMTIIENEKETLKLTATNETENRTVAVISDMTSKELNERIGEICDEPEKYRFECFGGKSVPYIGWFWRTVDFDQVDGYYFGVTPTGSVGFMENNKWDYDRIRANAEQWKRIKELLIEAVNTPTRQTLRAANEAIQSLLP